MSGKTEPATPRRLRRARLEGDSPISAVPGQALAFVVGLALLPALLAATAARAAALLEQGLSEPSAVFSPLRLAADVLSLSLPLIGGCALTALAAGLVQTGGVVSMKKLAPDLSRSNPIHGLKNLVRPERFVALFRSLLAASLIAAICVLVLGPELGSLAAGVGQLGPSVELGLGMVHKLGWLAALVGLALAAVDVVATRYWWFRRLRMSPDEIKRERRQAEGDPELKQARSRAHREMLAGAALNTVKDATVVIVNPTHLATALKYDEQRDNAPRVLTQGAGDLARKIVEAAHAYGVAVVRNVPLARALGELQVGEEIPEELYEAIAEVLGEVFERGAGP